MWVRLRVRQLVDVDERHDWCFVWPIGVHFAYVRQNWAHTSDSPRWLLCFQRQLWVGGNGAPQGHRPPIDTSLTSHETWQLSAMGGERLRNGSHHPPSWGLGGQASRSGRTLRVWVSPRDPGKKGYSFSCCHMCIVHEGVRQSMPGRFAYRSQPPHGRRAKAVLRSATPAPYEGRCRQNEWSRW